MTGPYEALLGRHQFVCWKLEYRNGKPTKVPCAPTGGPVDVTNPANHLTYEQASRHSVTGIGFVLTENDPFFLIDIDKCLLPSGQWSETANTLLSLCSGALVETSHSGKGLHVIGSMAQRPRLHSNKNTKLGLEFYHKERFIALGNMQTAVGDAAVNCDQSLATILSAFFPPRAAASSEDWTHEPCEGWAGPTDDDELVTLASRSKPLGGAFTDKATFADLWAGNIDVLAAAYPPQNDHASYDGSSADLALANKLAFYTGHDCERIVRLMWKSGLVRDKWQREDYMRSTVLRATSNREQFYGSSMRGPAAADENTFTELATLINDYVADTKRQPEIIDAILNFRGSAAQTEALKGRAMQLLKDDGSLTRTLKRALDGTENTAVKASTVATSSAQLEPIVLFKDVPERAISRATGVHGSNAAIMLEEVFGGRLATFNGVLRWWSGIEWQVADEPTLLRLVSSALSPDQDKMPNVKGTAQALVLKAPRREPPPADRRVYFQNGVLDATTGVLTPHDENNNNTSCLSVPYDPSAPASEWFAHLKRVFGGLHDEYQRVELLQEIIGWLLITDDLNLQKCIVFDGAPRAGKGVILDALSTILGDGKCGFVSFSDLADGKTQSAFIGKDVVVDHEAKPPVRQDVKRATGFMNKVASNEPASIQLLNTQSPWTGRLNCKFIFACNGVPVLIDDSGASSTRFLLLRFERSFEGQEDRHISTRMAADLEGIAAWGVEGLKRLLANQGQFTVPDSSVDAVQDLKSGSQPLLEFINEYCVIGTGEKCHASQLWSAYRRYASEANHRASSRGDFLRNFQATTQAKGVVKKKSVRIGDTVTSGFEGLSVKAAEAAAFQPVVVAGNN